MKRLRFVLAQTLVLALVLLLRGSPAIAQVVKPEVSKEIDKLIAAGKDSDENVRKKANESLTGISARILVTVWHPDNQWTHKEMQDAFKLVERIGAPAEKLLAKLVPAWRNSLESAKQASENAAAAGIVDARLQKDIRRLSACANLGQTTLDNIRESVRTK